MTEGELLAILECLKQLCGILFGYEINVCSSHKNLVFAVTLGESQRVMFWPLILETFRTYIQHIDGVNNIEADTISRFPPTSINKYKTCTCKAQCRANDLFAIVRLENNEDYLPLNL